MESSNMKVAILIPGILRDLDQSFQNIKDFLVEPLNADVFIHTWIGEIKDEHYDIWPIKEFNKPEYYNEPMKCSEQILTENVKKYIDFVSIVFEKEQQEVIELNEFILQKAKFQKSKNKSMSYNFYSSLYKLYKVNELRKEYEQEHNFKYDYIIRIRTELTFIRQLTENDFKLANNSILIPSGGDYSRGINDMVAIAQGKQMNHYCSLYKKLKNYLLKDEMIFSCHEIWKHHLSTEQVVRFFFPYMLRGVYPTGNKEE